MKIYRLYDKKEMAYVNSVNYPSQEAAEEEKQYMLDHGEYPDEPHTVIAIHVFEDNTCIENEDQEITGNELVTESIDCDNDGSLNAQFGDRS